MKISLHSSNGTTRSDRFLLTLLEAFIGPGALSGNPHMPLPRRPSGVASISQNVAKSPLRATPSSFAALIQVNDAAPAALKPAVARTAPPRHDASNRCLFEWLARGCPGSGWTVVSSTGRLGFVMGRNIFESFRGAAAELRTVSRVIFTGLCKRTARGRFKRRCKWPPAGGRPVDGHPVGAAVHGVAILQGGRPPQYLIPFQKA
ncbi:MAG TPA: hypothetical protein VHV99_26095 [Paraburkholderia sp.]|nr:hypothetical protein [Paraburkholderia sp.]